MRILKFFVFSIFFMVLLSFSCITAAIVNEQYNTVLKEIENSAEIDFSQLSYIFNNDGALHFIGVFDKKNNFYCSNEITLELQDLGQVTGIVVDSKTKKIIKAKGVKVILKIDKRNRRGWSIKKAYPIK